MKNGFTMIELIFVIVILGILSAVAIPKFSATRDDAYISKARSDISSIRSAIISERQTRLIKGDYKYINKLHSSNDVLFDGNGTDGIELLMYGIKAEDVDGHWQTSPTCTDTEPDNNCTYTIKILNEDNDFLYTQSNGKFKCTQGSSAPSCDLLTR